MIRVINICALIGLYVPEDQGCQAETLHHLANPRYKFQLTLALLYLFNRFHRGDYLSRWTDDIRRDLIKFCNLESS